MSDREFLVESNIQDVLKLLISDKKLSIVGAMQMFYTSEVFQKLQDYKTGLYLESAAYIYELYKTELENNCIVQDEI